MQALTFYYYDIPSILTLIAGILLAFHYSRLNRSERIVAIVVLLNIAADTTAYILMHFQLPSTYIYNYFLPIERSLSLVVYTLLASKKARERTIFAFGMAAILCVHLVGMIQDGFALEFNTVSNIVSALIFTVMSYLFLRSVSTGASKGSVLIIAFGIANLLYSWVTVSALSALPLALKLNVEVAKDLADINLIGYTLWSGILIFAIRWKLKKS